MVWAEWVDSEKHILVRMLQHWFLSKGNCRNRVLEWGILGILGTHSCLRSWDGMFADKKKCWTHDVLSCVETGHIHADVTDIKHTDMLFIVFSMKMFFYCTGFERCLHAASMQSIGDMMTAWQHMTHSDTMSIQTKWVESNGLSRGFFFIRKPSSQSWEFH